MMKPSTLFRRDSITYSLMFIIWAVVIYLMNAHYTYFGAPFPGVSLGPQQSVAETMKAMTDAIARQELLLGSEKNKKKRGQSLEIIGTTFFQLYSFTRKQEYLDSASLYCGYAEKEDAKVSSVHYMLGRIMSEKKDYGAAKAQYEKAIACDPHSPLSYQTLGILLWFNFKQSGQAKPYFEKALSIDSVFPTAHYVLGEIALEKNDLLSAVTHFESETKIYALLSAAHKNTAIDPGDIRMAACFSSLRLANLYSTSFVDAQKAQDRFGLYMNLETDPQRRQASINEIQKYWKTGQSVNNRR